MWGTLARTMSLEFTLNGAKNKKHPVSSSSVDGNALLMREVNREWPDWFELTKSTVTQFFVLDVYNSGGTPLTVDQIYMQLEKIWNSSLQTNKEPIGILTFNHCNSWGKAYNNIIKDKTNKESVRAIQKSIFTVCLDTPLPRVSDVMYHTRAAVQMLHGGGSMWNSGNRWFDKTLQFFIGEDGTYGLIYEHAPAEAPPIVSLIDHVVEYTKKSEMVRTPMIPLNMPQKLCFNITLEIKKDIEEAKQNMNM